MGEGQPGWGAGARDFSIANADWEGGRGFVSYCKGVRWGISGWKGGRYFGVCVVLVEKGWWFGASIDPQLEGGTLSKRHGPVSRQAVLESGVVTNSCCSPLRGGPPQVWVKGGAIDFYALSDGGLQLGVGR